MKGGQTNKMTNEQLEKWDSFCGSNFLKVEHVKDEKDIFVVIGIELFTDDKGSLKPRLTLEKNEESYLFDLNVTNSNFCRNNGILNPRKLIGKKLFFKKILVISPKTKKEVESLRISKIE